MISRILLALAVLAGCTGAPEPLGELPEAESPDGVVVTRWTAATELFMEYPPLRVGETSRFAIHLTDLSSFQPLREGRVSVVLDYDSGADATFAVQGPSIPGIFGVDVSPTRVGQPLMTIRLDATVVTDSHALGPTSVLGEHESWPAVPAAAESGLEEISFLKEQQWNLDFATDLVEVKTMQESTRVPAVVEPRSGGQLAVTAPISGLLLPSTELPTLGAQVQEDQKLCTITPLWDGPLDRSSLQLALDEAKLEVERAARERQRVERLLAAGAVPARRLAEARTRESVSRARFEKAARRMDYYDTARNDAPHKDSRLSFEVRAHLAGIVTGRFVMDGAHVKEGDKLLEIAAVDTVYVSGTIPESQSAMLRSVRGAEIELPPGQGVLPTTRLVSKGRVVDPVLRTLKATYAADNRGERLAIGQSVFLRLFTSHAVEAATIPVSAVVEDGRQQVVYVQVGGESFERRPIELGNRRGAVVQARNGLNEGERIVTKGAYLVRLASMATEAPAHGHVH